ncbi:MAG: hypothetical protein A2Z96_08000 [Spirochaetes bacterium GWB1_48_6]|nr:MAG: hypothetical protein A2Z96_08000 [Spirochaetes bacterium GWB1_48_6]
MPIPKVANQLAMLIVTGFPLEASDNNITMSTRPSLRSFHQSGLAMLTRDGLDAENSVATSNIEAKGTK